MSLGKYMLVLGAIFCASGCEEPESVPPEPKRADDLMTQAEVDSFLSIIDSLPEGKLPDQIPPLMLPPPQWSQQRTLPVSELVKEEEKMREDRKSIDWFIARFPSQSRFLK